MTTLLGKLVGTILGKGDLKRIGMLAGVHLLAVICGIASNVVWARWMPQEVFGGFRVVLGVANLTGTLCLLGTGQAAIMSAARNIDGNFGRLVRAKLLANFVGGLVVLGAAGYYAFGTERSVPIAYGLVVMAMLFPAYNLSDLWTSWLNGKSRFGELAKGRVMTSFLALASVVTVTALGVTDLWAAVAWYFILMAGQNILMLRKALSLRANQDQDNQIITFGRHATVAMMFGSLMALDTVILNHFHSAAEVAVYAIALLFTDQIKAVFSIFNQVLGPRMYGYGSLTELWLGFRLQFMALTAGFIVLGLAGFAAIPTLTLWLFSARYAQAAEYGKWLWLTVAVLGSTTLLGMALTARQYRISLYASGAVYPILLFVLYLFLAERGVIGMVIARISATSILANFFVLAFFTLMMKERRTAAQAEHMRRS